MRAGNQRKPAICMQEQTVAFASSDYGTKGCYYYPEGHASYSGAAFFGLKGLPALLK